MENYDLIDGRAPPHIGFKEKEREKFNDWLEGKTDELPDFLNLDNLPPEVQPFAPLFGQFWHNERLKNIQKKKKS